MSSIDYNHRLNQHTLTGPAAALPLIFDGALPASLLDVGCGTGSWLRAAQELGIADVQGIDGVAIPPGDLLVESSRFRCLDLRQPWDLGRRFEVVLCLEVAEHLEAAAADGLLAALARHADTIAFSAAPPGQPGQHHVHCQWPEFWQDRFNALGFACSDDVRWRLWREGRIEPWYRQNLMIARRDPATAGRERRIAPVVHPDLLPYLERHWREVHRAEQSRRVAQGMMPAGWYGALPFTAVAGKIRRRLTSGGAPVDPS